MGKHKKNIDSKVFLIDCILILLIMSAARILIKKILMSVLNLSVTNLNIVNILSIMIVFISTSLFLKHINKFNPNIYIMKMMSNRYDNKKIRLSLMLISIILISWKIVSIHNLQMYSLVIMLLAVLIIPIYEEIIFRQYLWNYAKNFIKSKNAIFVLVTIVYTLSIYSYWDIISDNLSVLSSAKFTIDIIIQNIWIYGFIGVITGFVRRKYNDIYLCIFVHIILSSIIFSA